MKEFTTEVRRRLFLDVLCRVRDERRSFDMEHWIELDKDPKGHVCCTAACAVGWAMMDPVMAAAGLGGRPYIIWGSGADGMGETAYGPEDIMATAKKFAADMMVPISGVAITPAYRGNHSMEAVSCFLGILPPTADYCFMPDSYKTSCIEIGDVIARVEEVFAENPVIA